MRILFTGVGECKIYEIIEMEQCPPEGATINFDVNPEEETGQEWSVRTVVWHPKNSAYDIYCVVGKERPSW